MVMPLSIVLCDYFMIWASLASSIPSQAESKADLYFDHLVRVTRPPADIR